MLRVANVCLAIGLWLLALFGTPLQVVAQDSLDRTALPIQEPKPPLYRELDARNATPPPSARCALSVP